MRKFVVHSISTWAYPCVKRYETVIHELVERKRKRKEEGSVVLASVNRARFVKWKGVAFSGKDHHAIWPRWIPSFPLLSRAISRLVFDLRSELYSARFIVYNKFSCFLNCLHAKVRSHAWHRSYFQIDNIFLFRFLFMESYYKIGKINYFNVFSSEEIFDHPRSNFNTFVIPCSN